MAAQIDPRTSKPAQGHGNSLAVLRVKDRCSTPYFRLYRGLCIEIHPPLFSRDELVLPVM